MDPTQSCKQMLEELVVVKSIYNALKEVSCACLIGMGMLLHGILLLPPCPPTPHPHTSVPTLNSCDHVLPLCCPVLPAVSS